MNSTKCKILILVQTLPKLDWRLHLGHHVYRILNSLNLLKKFLINNFLHKVKTDINMFLCTWIIKLCSLLSKWHFVMMFHTTQVKVEICWKMMPLMVKMISTYYKFSSYYGSCEIWLLWFCPFLLTLQPINRALYFER